jgi:ribosomal protein L32
MLRGASDDGRLCARCAADVEPTPLVECPVCGRVGLPERIDAHDC